MPKSTQQHHGARHRDRQAEDDGGSRTPPEGQPGEGAEPCRDGDLCNRARHRHPVDVQQVAQAEVEPNPEHQQSDPDLGQLERRVGIGHEPRRERTDGDPSKEVSDDRRDADKSREITGNERRAQRDRDGGDEVGAVRLDGAMLEELPFPTVALGSDPA